MRIRKLLPAVFIAAALTLTIPVSIYAAEDDNQTIQSQTVDIEVDENVILHIPYSLASNYQESDYVSRNQVYAYNPIINESGDTSLEVYLLNSNLKDFTFPESFWGVPVTRIAEGACNNKFTGSAIHVLKHAASFRILHYQTACNILETTHSTTL